ncbi:glycosyltransferase family 2 protein [Candidatus Woesearchaeota archaeon]|nr:glycosyltransferase family 2 protein [Candidatus Woesearchaeota archaeon]
MIKYTILSPIYNEEGAIRELIERVNKTMNAYSKGKWEYLLIDDVSTDKSCKIMEELSKKYKPLRILRHKKQKGQAGCFATGFREAKGEIIVTLDGDLQVMPEDIPLFLNKTKEGYDLVNGIRENRKHPFWIKLASRIYNIFMLVFFDSPVMDSASNFTAVKTKFIKGVRLRGNDHRYIVPIAMRNGAKKIGEIIIKHNTRNSGKSKYKALSKYIRGGPEIIFAWIRFRMGYFNG